jgi:hypothetical protein
VPANLQSSSVTSSSATVSWASSTDDVAVAGYQIFREGILLGTTPLTSFGDNGLFPTSSYSYTVAAYDVADNVSAPSQPLLVTTSAQTAVPAFVQQNSATPQDLQGSVTVGFTNPQTAGNANILVIGWQDPAVAITSVTDSSGNVYQVAIPAATSRSSPQSQAIFYAANINSAASGNSVTVTFSQPAMFVDLRVAEYSGLSRSNPFDAGSTASGPAGLANSNAITTSADNELLIGAGMTLGTFSSGGFGFNTEVITSPNGDILEDQVVSAVGTYNSTATVNDLWLMQVAAFKAAGSQ